MRLITALVALTGFILLGSCSSQAQGSNSGSEAPPSIHLGMSLDEFNTLMPDAYKDAGNSNRYIAIEKIQGIEGRWTYYFNGGNLRWYVFSASEHKISRQVFDQFMKVSNDLVRRYEKEFGKARKVRRGIQEYQDPELRAHNGYMVQQASWDGDGGKRTVEFSFLGDHKNYSLMLSIQVGQ